MAKSAEFDWKPAEFADLCAVCCVLGAEGSVCRGEFLVGGMEIATVVVVGDVFFE